ncbi:TPA: transcriptional regulator, partial [Streptococcus agalactiae]|nr:transcriptional regulator [Streptococcus agalactiae]
DEIDLSTFEVLYRKTSKNLSDEEKKILEEDLREFLLEREKAIRAMNKEKKD